MDLQELVIPFSINSDKLKAGLSDIEGKVKTTVSGLSSVGKTIAGVGAAAATAGFAALTGFLVDSTQGAIEAQEIQAQLGAVLASTGGKAGMTAESVNELASSLSGVTKFEDDAIVSGENMLLTFTSIGKDVFPTATETMLDMSQALGQDMKSSAVQLGKALNDPINGMTALSRVGVSFTEEQKKQIETMQKAGDLAGAQKVILAELSTEFGGAARAAGETFAGKLEILKNKFGNIKDTIGGAVLPVLTQLATQFSTFLSDPAVLANIQNIAIAIGDFAIKAAEKIPQIITWFQNLGDWFKNNKAVMIGILAALTVAVVAFAVTSAISLWAMLAPMLPIIGIMVAVGVVVGALYQAWTTNFGGIRDITQNTVTAVIGFFTNLWNTLSTGAVNGWNNIKTTVKNGIDAVKKFFTAENFKTIGENLMKGIKEGIENGVSFVLEAAKNAAQEIWNAITGFFKIESPSKLFAGAGENLMLGLGKGIEEFTKVPVNMTLQASQEIAGVGMPTPASIPSSYRASSSSENANYKTMISLLERIANNKIDERTLADTITTGILRGEK